MVDTKTTAELIRVHLKAHPKATYPEVSRAVCKMRGVPYKFPLSGSEIKRVKKELGIKTRAKRNGRPTTRKKRSSSIFGPYHQTIVNRLERAVKRGKEAEKKLSRIRKAFGSLRSE